MTSMIETAPLVLLIEDEPIIGYEIESALSDAGYRVIGPIRSLSSANSVVSQPGIAVAIVDLLLTDGASDALVEDLLARDIPVIVTSGLSEQPSLTQRCAGWLVKPYDSQRLTKLLETIAPVSFK